MQLDSIQQELLSGLREHPGFQILLGLMKEQEGFYCDQMAAASTPKELHGLAEAYRQFRSFREFMESRVDTMAAELDRQRAEGPYEEPSSIDHAWLMRFGPQAA